ncbi:hypothetical protein A6A04_13860 [Paramagnetospirillum marisnigri]|uniref:Uncharacterized protein n=1 Tax=Paramagnetospirillum marisnigri TaxID=1285242 RepID=A0A178MWA8_9PROT|nr:hypothetical protein [Paramagnetospirillum marisnigri]OAN53686.1 hypothetical protein A6A04_13860 [Paramagnetospirillum marisnigri]
MSQDDQGQPNTPETSNEVGGADSANVTTLNALHMDGKGQEGLDDATENELADTSEAEGDDVAGFANVQSAGRTTFEKMVGGGINEGPATPAADNIQQDVAPASEPDNQVDARFENPHPQQQPEAQVQEFAVDAPTPPPIQVERPQDRVEDPRPDPRPEGIDEPEAPEEAPAAAQQVAAPVVTEAPPVEVPEDVVVNPLATAQTPTLDFGISDGIEDLNGTTPSDRKMKLDIDPKLQDSDGGSESLTITIKGVPDGFTFSDASGTPLGTQSGDSWTFDWPTNAPDLYLVRPEHYSGDLTFEVTATARESNGDTSSITKTLPVHVEAVADQPPLAVTHVADMENSWISLGGHITTQLVDADGSETLAVYITPKPGASWGGHDMPVGTQLNHGTLLTSDLTLEDGTMIKAGSWKVDPADLADLKVRPPNNVSDDFTFEVRSATTEGMNGDVAVNGPLDLRVDVGIVDPSVAGSGTGNEDTWIRLDLSANVNSSDGTETLTVWLENLPADAELRYATTANGHTAGEILVPSGGRYNVTDSLQNLDVRWKTVHKDDDISFKLRAVAEDFDARNSGDTPDRNTALGDATAPDTSQALADVTVVVKAVADQPSLTATGVGVEDKYISLNISSALVDAADGSENLTVYLTAPAGVVVNVYDAATGTYVAATPVTDAISLSNSTLGTATIPAGSYAVTAAQAAHYVRLTGYTAQSDGTNHDGAADLQVSVTSVATERGPEVTADSSEVFDRQSWRSVTVDVPVFGDADTPTTAVVDARQVINEDATYNLHTAIGGGHFAVETTNGVDSADGSQSIIALHVKPIEAGSRLFINGVEQTLPAADANGDRYWTLDPADVSSGRVTVAGPADWGSLNDALDKHFDVRSVTREADYAANTSGLFDGLTRTPTATSDWDRLTLGINPVADTPINLVANGIAVEDKYAALNISAASSDVDGSETVAYYIQPTATSPVGMVVKIADANGNLTDATRVDADFTLTDGTVVKAGSYMVTGAQAAQHVRVYGLDAQSDGANHNGNGDFNLGVTAVTSDGTTTAGASVNVAVTVFGDADTPTTAVVDDRQVINEDATYNLHTAIGGGHFAVETTNGVDSADGSQSIIALHVKPIEAGSRLFINGVEQTLPAADANGDRYWTLDPADVSSGRVTVAGPADWGSLNDALDKHFDVRSVTREADYAANTSGLFDGLTRTPTATSDWDRLTLGINPVADTPINLVANGIAVEDKYAALNISAASSDVDGSETVAYYIQPTATSPVGMVVKIADANGNLTDATRVDADFTLTDGTVVKAGSYMVTGAQAAQHVRVYGLDAQSDGANHNGNGDFNLGVTAVTSDGTTTAGASVNVAVTVFGDADTPTTAVVDDRQVINEDATYNLHTAIGGGHFAVETTNGVDSADGSQSIIALHVKPIEAGSRLFINGVEQALPADGYWTIDPADLAADKVTVAGPANWGDWSLDKHFDVRSVTREADHGANTSGLFDGLSRTATATSDWDRLTLGINPVADAPTLSASGIGVEDKYAVLNITTGLVDSDGSEQLSIYVSGLTGGRTLSAGTLLTDPITLANGTVIPAGSYQLTSAQLSGLKVQNLPLHSDDDFTLTVTSVATEKAADGTYTGPVAVTTVTPSVVVYGDADKPVSPVIEPAQTINEDDYYNLRTVIDPQTFAVNGQLVDTVRESLTNFRIKPIEAGSRLAISTDATITSGEIQALPASGYWTVSAADLFGGKVYVGGAANWSSLSSQLHFDIQVSTREADYNAGNSPTGLSDAGLTRSREAWSDWDRLTLQVNPVADATTVGASNTGNEDTAIGVTPTFTLVDTDGSEHLTGPVLFISSDPDMISGTLRVNGTVISGVDQGDGTTLWTIPESAVVSQGGSTSVFTLSGVTFTPSTHNANDMTYTIKVTTTDTDAGITHQTTATGAVINVTAVADQPTISVGSADVNSVVHLTEDTALNLGLVTNLVDGPNANPVGGAYNPDPEHFSSITLEQIPTGWTLLKDNHDGSYTQISISNGVADLTNLPLADVMLKPPTNLDLASASNYSFLFKSISAESENSSTATNSVSFKVVIDAVADTPTLQVTHVRTNEDVRVALDIRPAVTDTDGSESISDIFISGAPAGTLFYTGATGTTTVGTLGKLVNGAFVEDATGTVWRFAKADLTNLYLQPRPDSNQDFDLSVVARSTEANLGNNNDTADSIAQTLKVIVKGISDGVTFPDALHDGNVLVATGVEDNLVNPHFEQYNIVDVDAAGSVHGPETLSIVIKEIPANVTMSMTSGNEKYAKYLGTDANGNEQWSIDPNHLADVRFGVPANFSGTITGTVKLDLITTENDGDSLIASHDLRIVVTQDADAPSISVSSAIAEDGWDANGIPMTVTVNPGETVSGGIEEISNVTLVFNTADLAAFPPLTVRWNNTDYAIADLPTDASGNHVLDVTSGYNTATNQVSGLSIKGLPEDWSKDVPFKVSGTSSEYNADGTIFDSETRTVNGSVQISAVVDTPATFTVTDTDALTAGNQASGQVGSQIDLGLSLTLGDLDGSEPSSMYFVIAGVPNGVILTDTNNSVVNAGNGYWIVPYTAGSAGWHLYASSQLRTGEADLTIRAVLKDNDPDGGTVTDTFDQTLHLKITDADGHYGNGYNWWSDPNIPVLNPPSINATPKPGTEDVNFSLDNVSASPAATNGGTVTAIVVGTQQAGVSISSSAGWDNPFTGEHVIKPADIGTLTVNPPDDFAGDVKVNLKAVATDGDLTATTSTPNGGLVVATLDPDTDGASVSITAANSTEDFAGIPFTLDFQERDNDFSEIIANGGVITITLPSGSQLLLNGVAQTGTNGTYSLNVSDFGVSDFNASGHIALNGLSVVPPAHYHGSLTISASITVTEAGDTLSLHGDDASAINVLTTGSKTITLTAVADDPTITAANVSGNEDSWITFNVSIDAPDVVGGGTYSSEYLSIKLSGMPANAVIDGALKNSDGSWTVKDANVSLVQVNGAWKVQLSNVKILPPQDDSGTYTLTVDAYTLEPSNKSIAHSSGSFTVTVAGVADTPTVDPVAVNNGSEDVALPITLNAQLIDLSETLSVTITGVPTGASFVDAAGNAIGTDLGGGSWKLEDGDLFTRAGNAVTAKPLFFLGKLHESGSWAMTATATSVDGLTTATSYTQAFSITLAGVADTPTLTLTDLTSAADGYFASGNEDSKIAINIAAATPDSDSETVEVLISGAPAGSVLYNGATAINVSGDGFWHVPSNLLDANLKIQPPSNWNGDITLTVKAHTTEGATNGYSAEQSLVVHVNAINDAPDMVLSGASGQSEVGAITSPIYVIPEGTNNYININDNADGVANPDLTRMDISITTGALTGDGISMVGLQPRLDINGDLAVDFNGHTFGINFNQGTHTLSLTGTADANTYEALAEQLILTNPSGAMAPGVRTLEIKVYDAAGATDTVQTTATIGDVAQNQGVTLAGDTLGTVQWSATGATTLLGSGGNDILLVAGGDAVSSINGGAGIDQLWMQTTAHGHGDWLYAMDANNDIIATSASHPDTGEFIVHLSQGSATIDNTNHEVVFNNAAGTITFGDTAQQIAFAQIEKLTS